MRRRLMILSFVMGATGPLACSALPSVDLEASPADMEVLAGDWLGEYRNAALDRNGTIQFRLRADTGAASGEVRMMPAGSTAIYQRYSDAQRDERPHLVPQFLTIRFVRVAGGDVSGTLEKYWDPDLQTFAWTRFRGRVSGNIIEGTFRTAFERKQAEATGVWKVTRQHRETDGS